jgi:non-homologous end joining protein Ku
MGLPAGRALAVSLWELLDDQGRFAVARSCLHGRERLSVLVPLPDKVLGLQTLHWPAEVRQPELQPMLPAGLDEMSRNMLKQLLDGLHKTDLNWSLFTDSEQNRLAEYISSKAAGLEPVAADEPVSPVLSLMEALKRSVAC